MASSLKTACIPYSIIDSFADLSPKKITFANSRKNFRGQLEEALSGIGLTPTFRSTTIYSNRICVFDRAGNGDEGGKRLTTLPQTMEDS